MWYFPFDFSLRKISRMSLYSSLEFYQKWSVTLCAFRSWSLRYFFIFKFSKPVEKLRKQLFPSGGIFYVSLSHFHTYLITFVQVAVSEQRLNLENCVTVLFAIHETIIMKWGRSDTYGKWRAVVRRTGEQCFTQLSRLPPLPPTPRKIISVEHSGGERSVVTS